MLILKSKAHDLLWVKKIQGTLPDWYHHRIDHPVVVRRDTQHQYIPIGLRGSEKHMRVATWVKPEDVLKSKSAIEIVQDRAWNTQFNIHPLQQFKALELIHAIFRGYKLQWGIGGSLGYELATTYFIGNDSSDIDIILYPEQKLEQKELLSLWQDLQVIPFKPDVQIEMPHGAVALYEMIHSPNCVMLKTDQGPILTSDPW